MVRVWEPSLLPYLDDNRIVAAHAETHYIHAAILRGGGIWHNHPETRRFFKPRHAGKELLRLAHDLTVKELDLRGYNHKTPITGYSATLEELLEAGDTDCFDEPFEWLSQDKADLFRKWSSEQRWRNCLMPTGKFGWEFSAGYMVVKHEPKRSTHTFKPPRRPEVLIPDYKEYARLATIFPHREWTKYDRLRLKLFLESAAP